MLARPGRSAFVAVLVALATVTAVESQTQWPAADPTRGQAIAVGAFSGGAAGACQSCHGIDGAGDPAAGFPRLAAQPFLYLAKSLADYRAGRRQNDIMGPIAKAMTDQEIVDAAAYYAGTAGRALRLPPEAGPDALQRGAVLSAIGDNAIGVQACQNCHGPAGSGMGVQYPALAGQAAAYLESQLQAWKDGRRKGDTHAVMQGIANRLSDEDVVAVAAYLAALAPPVSARMATGGEP
jgi:cytochrome c553